MNYFPDAKAAEESVKENIFEALSFSVLPEFDQDYAQGYMWEEVQQFAAAARALLKELDESSFAFFTASYISDVLARVVAELYRPLQELHGLVVSSDKQTHIGKVAKIHTLFITIPDEEWRELLDAVTRANRPSPLKATITEINQEISTSAKTSAAVKAQVEYIDDWWHGFRDSGELWRRQQNAAIATEITTVEGLRKTLQDALLDMGTHGHAKRFKIESRTLRRESKYWLSAAVAVGSLIIAYVIWLEVTVDPAAVTWPFLAMKGVVISIGSVFLFAFMRNFSACRHNEMVNRQRQNALSTYQLFRDSADDDATKRAVLTEVMKATFAIENSGYLKAASETNLTTHIVEQITKDVKGT